MGANGSYDRKLFCVPGDKRTHDDTGYRIDGHKVLDSDKVPEQSKNVLNSNSECPIYLIAKREEGGVLSVQKLNVFEGHSLKWEIDLKFDSQGNLVPFNGKESRSHMHEWVEVSPGIVGRKVFGEGQNSHLPIPPEYDALIGKIVRFNKQQYQWIKK